MTTASILWWWVWIVSDDTSNVNTWSKRISPVGVSGYICLSEFMRATLCSISMVESTLVNQRSALCTTCLFGFTGPTLCTTIMVQRCLVDHGAVLCTTKAYCAPWCTRETLILLKGCGHLKCVAVCTDVVVHKAVQSVCLSAPSQSNQISQLVIDFKL